MQLPFNFYRPFQPKLCLPTWADPAHVATLFLNSLFESSRSYFQHMNVHVLLDYSIVKFGCLMDAFFLFH